MKLSTISEAPSRRDLLSVFRPKSSASEQPEKTEQADYQEQDPLNAVGLGKQDRRSFIKTTAGAAASAIPGGSVAKIPGAIGKVKNLFDNLSDEQLLKTPEHAWVGKIDSGRMNKIVREHPDHGVGEAVAKISKLITYGMLRAAGAGPNSARNVSDMIDRHIDIDKLEGGRSESTVNNAREALKQITNKWRTSQSELMDYAAKRGYLGDQEHARQFASFIRQNGQKLGIKMDLGGKRHESESPEWHSERTRKLQAKTREWERNRNYDDTAIPRWEDDGGSPGPSFEDKLSRALGTINEARWSEIIGGKHPDMEDHPRRNHDKAPDVWWHGTSTARLPGIMANGLGGSHGVCLTLKRDLAKFSALRAASRFGGDPVVLEVRTAELDDTLSGTATDSSTTKPIPPKFIKIATRIKFSTNAVDEFKAKRKSQGLNDIDKTRL